MLPLSVFIIAKNEADRIGDTIRAVRHLTDDLVVVDSGSTDGTQEVAEALGARVIFNPWPGYGPQKRFAEEQCRHVWLLNLDADEVVPADLAARDRGAVRARRAAARRPTASASPRSFRARARRTRSAYALAPVRLYRKDRGRYSPSLVHDRVDLAAWRDGRAPQGRHPPSLGALARRPARQAQPLFRPAGRRPRPARGVVDSRPGGSSSNCRRPF